MVVATDEPGAQPDEDHDSGSRSPAHPDDTRALDRDGYALVPGAGGFEFPRGFEMDSEFRRAFLRRFDAAHTA